MVVILLLSSTYSTINGCDGGSNDSNTSTTSTGETAIPTTANLKANFEFDNFNTTIINDNTITTTTTNNNSTSQNTANSTKYLPQYGISKNAAIYPESSQNYYAEESCTPDYSWCCYISTSPPPQLPLQPPPPMEAFYHHDFISSGIPYYQQQQQQQYAPFNSFRPQINTIHQHPNSPQFNSYENSKTNRNKNFTNKSSTNSSDIVRHVTRVNFYDIDTFQVEFEPKDDDNICDTEAITKDEEWITKRKTELTTTRQIETRVKRQVVLEDGKVVEDSGPIVSTNTTEDTDKQETETTEKRDLGIPTDINNVESVDAVDGVNKDQAITKLADQELAVLNAGDGKIVKKMVPRPADGLVREINDKRVITHEEVKDYLETEDVKHFGDFSDETYVKAVNSGVENLEAVLLSSESKQQLVPLGPRIVANTTKSFKTIDSEDVQKRSLAQEDGTIITEKKKTTEHEIIVDKDLPEKDDNSTGSREQVKTVEATQRYYKQRDEQNVDLIADGKVVGTEMRYAAETMQVEKDGSLERPGDWDSLSDRMRKMRRQQHKSLMQQHKEAALLADRKDALTKRPLDFDREEETRKGETMKWLESHFGSESTASNDSRDEDAAIEPTKKTYFNVTIKSNEAQQATTTKTYERKLWEERKPHSPPLNVAPATTPIASKTKYYQGISNWNERKETPHFASKAFRDDLKETIERNRLRRGNAAIVHTSREKLNENNRYIAEPQETYVSREDILQQKRQSLSSQFLARNKRASRENLNDIDNSTLGRNLGGSRNDLRYNKPMQENNHRRPYMNGNVNANSTMKRSDYIESRAKSYERMSNDSTNALRYDEVPSSNLRPFPHNDNEPSTQTLGRPTVPQRRRAIERKLRQESSVSPTVQTIVPLDSHRNGKRVSPARSRSSTPPNDYDLNDTPHAEYIPSNSTSTLTKKQTQRTRFAPTTTMHTTPRHQTVQTQTTPPSNLSTSTATSHKSSKVGQVIGNSLRKLVNKIRSVSAERKLRMKSKSKSREQSPSFQQDTLDRPINGHAGHTTTYQQYNVIDSHIGGQPASNESEQESNRQTPGHNGSRRDITSHERPITNGVGQSHHQQQQQLYKRASSADPYTNDSDVHSPRQRYYLGEDPYSSTLYGQENLYDPSNRKNNVQYVRNRENLNSNQNRKNNQQYGTHKYGEEDSIRQKTTSHTLGRYPRGRITESTPNLHQDYRTIQTLPRKLNDASGQNSQYGYHKMTQRSATTLNGGHHTLGHPERRPSTQQNITTTHQLSGPAKPARTYAKALNRSKSFNVHGLNGSNDPSPIYIEKLTKNNYNNYNNNNNNNNYNSNLKQSQAYKSNPMLHSGLKSPSIVNLISRSQKDLTKIGTKDDTDSDLYAEQHTNYAPTNYVALHSNNGNRTTSSTEKKQIFLKELHERAPDLYRTLEGGGNDYITKTPTKYPLHAQRSLETRSPIEINKDTASIYRRGSLSTEEYVPVPTYSRKGYGTTIVEVRK